jgi:hypothetical protein
MWIATPDDSDELVPLVITEPIPILQACRESRAVALEYYTKFKYEQASGSVFKKYRDEYYEFCENLNPTSPTYTYINWVDNIIFLEYKDCSFNQAIGTLGNRLQEAQQLLVDKRFGPDVSQIRDYFNEARQCIWVTPRDSLESWDLQGSLMLQIPANKLDTFVAMCSQIFMNFNIQIHKCPNGRIVAEAEVYTSKDIRYWPLWKRVLVSNTSIVVDDKRDS